MFSVYYVKYPNGRDYVGSTTQAVPFNRAKSHQHLSKANKLNEDKWDAIVDMHKRKEFAKIVIRSCKSVEEMLVRELMGIERILKRGSGVNLLSNGNLANNSKGVSCNVDDQSIRLTYRSSKHVIDEMYSIKRG